MAEAVRFELTEHCCSAVFKTAGLNHSPKLPNLNTSLGMQLCYSITKQRVLKLRTPKVGA
jgi:hypothetical protein